MDSQTKKKRGRARKRRGKLSLAEVQNALYIDFEGRTGCPPVLLGTLAAPAAGLSDVVQYVVDPVFAVTGAATNCTVIALDELVSALVDRAINEGRRIVAWSEHDLDVVRDHCSPATYQRFAARYRNARAFADRWREQLHPHVVFDTPGRKENALANYEDMIRYEVPERFGPGKTGEHLRRLIPPLTRGKIWDELSPAQRGYWDDVLGHNQHDCVGMYEVCKRAASELDTKRDEI